MMDMKYYVINVRANTPLLTILNNLLIIFKINVKNWKTKARENCCPLIRVLVEINKEISSDQLGFILGS